MQLNFTKLIVENEGFRCPPFAIKATEGTQVSGVRNVGYQFLMPEHRNLIWKINEGMWNGFDFNYFLFRNLQFFI